jgi:hypothetical protein
MRQADTDMENAGKLGDTRPVSLEDLDAADEGRWLSGVARQAAWHILVAATRSLLSLLSLATTQHRSKHGTGIDDCQKHVACHWRCQGRQIVQYVSWSLVS